MTANTQYCFTVTAVSGNAESEKSAAACATTWVDAIEELSASFNIYPNPVSDKLYIETETEIENVVVYTITGVVAQQSTANGQQLTIDVANLNSGVYFVKVVTANGEVVKRVLKH